MKLKDIKNVSQYNKSQDQGAKKAFNHYLIRDLADNLVNPAVQ